MASLRGSWLCVVAVSCFLGLLAGCGGSNEPKPIVWESEPQPVEAEEPSTGLPTVAIPGFKTSTNKPAKPAEAAAPAPLPKGAAAKGSAAPPAANATPAVAKEPEKGSPEWLLLEIQRVRVLPLPASGDDAQSQFLLTDKALASLRESGLPAPVLTKLKALKDKPFANEDQFLTALEKVLSEAEIDRFEDAVLDVAELNDAAQGKQPTAAEEQKMKDNVEKTRIVRRERNLQIIKLAEECIAKTATKPDQDAYFDAAVHHLLDARLQLALQGDTASSDALFEAAKVFYDRKPQSASAIEAQLTLVNLTHACALRYGQTEPKWIQEFAKHSQLFATHFPDEQDRAVALLSAAARSCELNGLTDDAKTCYSLLATKYKDTPQGLQAAGVVRRFQLKGKTLELTGPTMEGDDLNIETYRGKMVIVVFWATHAKPFSDQLPKLQATMKKYEKYAAVVGINLDADENAVLSFIEQSNITWPQIFSPNRALRGWNSPLAVHYGINNLPTIWLVDPNGVVTDTAIDAENLETRLREVYLPFLKANSVKPASATK